jgi:hypothetical protein
VQGSFAAVSSAVLQQLYGTAATVLLAASSAVRPYFPRGAHRAACLNVCVANMSVCSWHPAYITDPAVSQTCHAVTLFSMGAANGALRQMVAGLLGPATNWRLPFLVMAAPTLLLAFLLLATVKEPPRGGKECGGRSQLATQHSSSYGEVSGLVLRSIAGSRMCMCV